MVNISDENHIPELLQELDNLMRYTVEVGVLSGKATADILMIAHVHEYGANIQVTEAMRAYLHTIGIHLSSDTTQINIPERSYLRSGFDEWLNQLEDLVEEMVGEVVDRNISAYDMYNVLGAELASAVQKYLTDVSHPGLHPVTRERKGSSNPLIDSGRLRQGITWQVVTR